MALEVVSVEIHKLSNLLTEESQTLKKVKHEIQRVIDEVQIVVTEHRGMQIILDNAERQDPSNRELTDWVMKFLSIVYHVGDAIESFVLAQTRLQRMGIVKKHTLVIANELNLCRGIPDEMDYPDNVSRLKYRMKIISKQIQEWKAGSPLLALAPNQGHQTTRQPEQPCSHSVHLPSSKEPEKFLKLFPRSNSYLAPKRPKTIFKKDVEKLMRQLTSDNEPLEIICVFGDNGAGETAHVKTVYNKADVKEKFACRSLVTVQPMWSLRHLLKTILQQVTSMQGKEKLKDEDRKEKLKDEDLIMRLNDFLKGKRYLIVIQDIKSLDLLIQLKRALPDERKGSRVVITTSNEKVASFEDASSRYDFKRLDMDDGFKFFISKTWGKKSSPFSADNMKDLKIKLAESCKGTLLNITMLAGLLSTRKVDYKSWSSVFEQHNFAIRSPSFDIFTFCYNDLPFNLKPCFLYLTLFRRGFEIPVRRLFWLWLAEGFVPQSSGNIPEDIVEGYLEELVKRNMVEITKRRSDESPKKCQLIGSLHDIFLPRALELGIFHLHQESDEYSHAAAKHPFRIRRVVGYTNIKDYSTSKAFNQNLQSYVSFKGRNKDMPAEEVRRFLERMIGVRGFGLLKVLDLEGVYQPRLPANLGLLFHLRYLGLRWTFLDTLPSSLGDLVYLETLDIKHTHITTLPISIWNMKHLHHLCLNGARLDISAQSNKRRGPSQLHTLCGLLVDENLARKIGSTLSRMTNLRKLDLTRQSSSTVTTMTTTTTTTKTTTTTTSHLTSYEEIVSWIALLSSLQALRLRSTDKMGRPSELIVKPFSRLQNLSNLYLLGHLRESLVWYQIPPGIKVLTLSVSQLDRDPMPTLSQLPKLMVLRLLAASYVGEEMHCPRNGFPSLRVLKLWKLEKLKILTVDEETMQCLHTLEIRCCKELMELPVTLLHIKSFDNLILTDMPKSFASAIREIKNKHTKVVENITTF